MIKLNLILLCKITVSYIIAIMVCSTPAYADYCSNPELKKLEKYADALDSDLYKASEEDVYSACKVMPNNSSKAILAFTIPSISCKSPEVQRYDLVILIVDVSNSTVLSKHVAKSAIESDALAYQMISIDTANYMVSPQTRAFGVRVFHQAGNNYSEGALSLFLEKDTKIIKLLSGLMVNKSRSEVNQACDAVYTDTATTLALSTTKTNGFYNLIASTEKTTRTETPAKNVKLEHSPTCELKTKTVTSSKQLTFNGTTYIRPQSLKASMLK